jgi:AcrR family transcriptional regulator
MAKSPSTPPPDEPTSGRDAAVAALVEAATRLFAASGPDGVPLRAVAAEAGVNYGLIHQYVGTKDDLLQLVARSVSESSAEGFATAADLHDVAARFVHSGPTPYVSLLTWSILQGRDSREILGRSPALATIVERLDDTPDRDARVAAFVALSLGWQVFGDFVAAGLGHDDAMDELTDAVRSLAVDLLDLDPSREG